MMTHEPPADKAFSLRDGCAALATFVRSTAANGLSFHDFEQGLWSLLLRAGRTATAGFLQEQGTGDLGDRVTLPPDQVERRRRTALELDLAPHLPKGYHGPGWTAADAALLGTLPDTEIARRTGRTA
jgi:hypothetical protein